MARHVFVIGFLISVSKPWILIRISVENPVTINKPCTLYLPSKPDKSPSFVTVVKEKKKQEEADKLFKEKK